MQLADDGCLRCDCGLEAKQASVSKDGPNKGRSFWCVSLRLERRGEKGRWICQGVLTSTGPARTAEWPNVCSLPGEMKWKGRLGMRMHLLVSRGDMVVGMGMILVAEVGLREVEAEVAGLLEVSSVIVA